MTDLKDGGNGEVSQSENYFVINDSFGEERVEESENDISKKRKIPE